MTLTPHNDTLINALIAMAQQAGQAIMAIYDTEIQVDHKTDNSPVTLADTQAEDIILAALATTAPDIPIVSEEAASQGIVPDIAEIFFLVDPLDGTREFIKHNGEFTVNIALIENGCPVMGVVYAPALSRLFWASGPTEAFEAKLDISDEFAKTSPQVLRVRKPHDDGLTMISSRSHGDPATQKMISEYTIRDTLTAGSSLKFCLIAAGEADLYPRAGRTMEWDTAAGQAVLTAAGGTVLNVDGTQLRYGKTHDGLANPPFMAHGQTRKHQNI